MSLVREIARMMRGGRALVDQEGRRLTSVEEVLEELRRTGLVKAADATVLDDEQDTEDLSGFDDQTPVQIGEPAWLVPPEE